MRPKATYIAGIDAIRFAAAMSVVFFHLAFATWAASEREAGSLFRGMATYPELVHAAWFGWVGVEVFFVISGIVIAMSAASAPGALAFLKHRALRLYPAIWICAPITLMIVAWFGLDTGGHVAERLVRSLSLFPLPPWAEGVYWTLSVELCFYLCVAAILALRVPDGLNRFALVLGAWSTLFLLYTAIAEQRGWYLFSPRAERLLLLRYGCNFAVGMLLASGRFRRALWLFVPASAFGIWMKAAFWAGIVGPGEALRLVPVVIWLVMLGLIHLSLVFREQALDLPARVLRGLRWVGLATYPLYLVHPMLGALIMRLALIAGWSRWTALAIALVGLPILAIGIAEFLEPPLRRLLRSIPAPPPRRPRAMPL